MFEFSYDPEALAAAGGLVSEDGRSIFIPGPTAEEVGEAGVSAEWPEGWTELGYTEG